MLPFDETGMFPLESAFGEIWLTIFFHNEFSNCTTIHAPHPSDNQFLIINLASVRVPANTLLI